MNKKIAIFGSGYIYERYKNRIPAEHEIAFVLDNDVTYHGTFVDEIKRIYPREILSFDVDMVILMSEAAEDMRNQMLWLGFDMKKVIHYKDYLGGLPQKREILSRKKETNHSFRSVLIISNELGYHGAPVVVLGLVICLTEMGYKVSVAAPNGARKFIDEICNAGAEVILQEGMEHANWENLKWTKGFDKVIVNSLPMIMCAVAISKYRDVTVYLHDSPGEYTVMSYWWERIRDRIESENIKICAVSSRARENFIRFFPYDREIEILSAYVVDENNGIHKKSSKEVTFAVVGPFLERKGQMDILDMAIFFKDNTTIKFLFVGGDIESEYASQCLKKISENDCCEYYGQKTRDEMWKLYQEIDAVIVPSEEETLSLVAMEAMMMGRVCIVSDHCGIAEYIEHGKNGFVFPRKDMDALKKILIQCEDNREELKIIGERSRRTYKDNFSYQVFVEKLRRMLE